MAKVKNSIDYLLVKEVAKNWKDGSIFRVVKFLNEQANFLKACGLKKGQITIDLLKEVNPSYFKQVITNKKDGTSKTVDRVTFSYYPFVLAMRKKYGVLPVAK